MSNQPETDNEESPEVTDATEQPENASQDTKLDPKAKARKRSKTDLAHKRRSARGNNRHIKPNSY